ESLTVEAVLEGRDDPGRTRLPTLLVALGLALAADGRHEGQPLAVGRPRYAFRAVLERRQPGGLAAVGRHHVELELFLLAPLGQECEPPAVGGPPRLDVAPRPSCEATRLAADRVDDPDVRQVFVPLLGERRDDERDPSAVGRDLRVGHERDAREVLGHHAPAPFAHTPTDAWRSTSRASSARASATAPSPSISAIAATTCRAMRRPSVACHPSAPRLFSIWIVCSTR